MLQSCGLAGLCWSPGPLLHLVYNELQDYEDLWYVCLNVSHM